MKVLFDSQAFDMQSHGGVSRCFTELYAHLPQDIEARISVLETRNIYLQALGFKPSGSIYRNFLYKNDNLLKHILFKFCYNIRHGAYSRWNHTPKINQLESIEQIKAGDFDLLHPTFFNPYFIRYLYGKPYVITVHDMIPELFPKYYARNDFQIIQKKSVISKAAHIIAVSQKTKEDLCQLLKIKEDKVSVIHHGVDDSPFIPSTVIKHKYEYILFVGERHFYKNFKSFVNCCVPILKRHQHLNIICTGKPFTEDEKNMFINLGIESRFIHEFPQTNQEMLDLYHNAITFVYPSSYEGFGIPILEAYKADCPVMLNNASCFPEIAGDAAIYFNMNEVGSTNFEEQFETFYHLNSNEKQNLINKQKERLKLYSWEKSANQLANVYRQTLQ
nr:glycosyltransferase family 1 protein [uncultured Prevotella sp.]